MLFHPEHRLIQAHPKYQSNPYIKPVWLIKDLKQFSADIDVNTNRAQITFITGFMFRYSDTSKAAETLKVHCVGFMGIN